MNDIDIRVSGRAGRITLNRAQALNALTPEMGRAIEIAIDNWANDDRVEIVIIDAAGERAFCSGGDIAEIYRTLKAKDYSFARNFWADEYRLNAKIFNFPKPYAAFMQGFTMGGGVGISCHGSHRVVGDTSQIAMPECGIGLVPDVGGSLILSQSPGRLGEYLGTTGRRMGPADAILAGFADYYIPEAEWPKLIAAIETSGDPIEIDRCTRQAPEGKLAKMQDSIDACFAGETAGDILRALRHDGSDFARSAQEALSRQCPLSVACCVEIIHRVRGSDRIERALDQEFRFVWHAAEEHDFIEGIRAAIIDKDRKPRWRHAAIDEVSATEVSRMLMPLGRNALKL
jgi:enoyl-CoA hydratase